MRPGWRPSTASHTQTFTLIPGTQKRDRKGGNTCKYTQSLAHSLCTHTCIFTEYTHTQCEANAGNHKLFFMPHQVCKYMSGVYICSLLQGLLEILYYIRLCFIFCYKSVKLIEKMFYISQSVSLFCFCLSLIRPHKESCWVASYVLTRHLNPNVLNLNRDGSHRPPNGRLYTL